VARTFLYYNVTTALGIWNLRVWRAIKRCNIVWHLTGIRQAVFEPQLRTDWQAVMTILTD